MRRAKGCIQLALFIFCIAIWESALALSIREQETVAINTKLYAHYIWGEAKRGALPRHPPRSNRGYARCSANLTHASTFFVDPYVFAAKSHYISS